MDRKKLLSVVVFAMLVFCSSAFAERLEATLWMNGGAWRIEISCATDGSDCQITYGNNQAYTGEHPEWLSTVHVNPDSITLDYQGSWFELTCEGDLTGWESYVYPPGTIRQCHVIADMENLVSSHYHCIAMVGYMQGYASSVIPPEWHISGGGGGEDPPEDPEDPEDPPAEDPVGFEEHLADYQSHLSAFQAMAVVVENLFNYAADVDLQLIALNAHVATLQTDAGIMQDDLQSLHSHIWGLQEVHEVDGRFFSSRVDGLETQIVDLQTLVIQQNATIAILQQDIADNRSLLTELPQLKKAIAAIEAAVDPAP